jgi:hypothetical protein
MVQMGEKEVQVTISHVWLFLQREVSGWIIEESYIWAIQFEAEGRP